MVSIGISVLLWIVTKDLSAFAFRVAVGHLDGTKFYLSTRFAKHVAANMSGKTIFGDIFRPEKNTKILIHGFIDNHQQGSFSPIVEKAYLTAQDANVIGVDWSWWIGNDYFKTIDVFLRVVAKRIAIFLQMLVKQYEVDLARIHLIGHSLGAHTAGMVGLLIQKYSNGKKLGRITGLDPAAQGFFGRDLKLTKLCAEFVDTVHTDDYGFGLAEMNSHVDFYINGGNRQPACGSMPGACSHLIAPNYWEHAILNETAFLAVKCDSWLSFSMDLCCKHEKTYLGEKTSRQARGAFYLSTSKEPPYGLGKKGARAPLNSIFVRYATQLISRWRACE